MVKIKSLKVVKITLVLLVLLALIPEMVRYGAVKIIESMGVGEVTIGNADLNLFTAQMRIQELSIFSQNKQQLYIDDFEMDVDWLKLIQGELLVENSRVSGVKLSAIENDAGGWDVITFNTIEEPKDSVADNTDTGLPKITIDKLSVQDVRVNVDGAQASGNLLVKDFIVSNVSSWKKLEAGIMLDAKWNDSQIDIDLSVEHDLHDLKQLNIAAKGEITAHEISYKYKNKEVGVTLLKWNGDFKVAVMEDTVHFSIAGDFENEGLAVYDKNLAVKLISWEKLSVNQFTIDHENSFSTKFLLMEKLDALHRGDSEKKETSQESNQGSYYIKKLALNSIGVDSNNVISIENFMVDGGQFKPRFLKKGMLEVQEIIDSVLKDVTAQPQIIGGQEVSQAESNDKSAVYTFRLDRFEMVGDSYIHFADERFEVPIILQLNISELLIAGLNQLEPDENTTIVLNGKLGEFSSLNVSADARPFSDPLALSLSGNIKSFELPAISNYSETYMGYHLNKGQYDHQFNVEIENKNVTIENALMLRQLEVKAVDMNKSQDVESQLSIPLAMSLDMLRDGDGNIELKVPVQMSIDGSDLDISSIVNSAIGKALKNGATSYLKFALQPYGAVLMAAELINDKLSSVRLEPLLFASGTETLTSEQIGYVTKIIELMKARPALILSICGESAESDKFYFQQQQQQQQQPVIAPIQESNETLLFQLADNRAKGVKRLMINKGVAGERLLMCQPKYNPGGNRAVGLTM